MPVRLRSVARFCSREGRISRSYSIGLLSRRAILISSKRARARQSRICGFGTVRPKRRRANRWHAAAGRNLLRDSIGCRSPFPPLTWPRPSRFLFLLSLRSSSLRLLLPLFFSARASSLRRDLLIRSFALTFTSVFQRESPVIASLAVSPVLLGPDRGGISGDRSEWHLSLSLSVLHPSSSIAFPRVPPFFHRSSRRLLTSCFTFVTVMRCKIRKARRYPRKNFESRLTSSALYRDDAFEAVRSRRRRW